MLQASSFEKEIQVNKKSDKSKYLICKNVSNLFIDDLVKGSVIKDWALDLFYGMIGRSKEMVTLLFNISSPFTELHSLQ